MLVIASKPNASRNIFSIFFDMKVYCVLSLDEAILVRTQNIPFSKQKKKKKRKENQPKLSQICCYWIFSKGLKNEFERAVVNEPSMFEPLKFYFIATVL